MKLGDILDAANVMAEIQAHDKEGVLKEMTAHLCRSLEPPAPGETEIFAAILERERLGSTGVGQGVAIPHARMGGVPELVACFGRSKTGIAFDAIDQQPVSLFFLLLVPEGGAGSHLKALARVARLLKNDDFRKALARLADAGAIYRALIEEDAKVSP
ncbi:MAG: PTS sugar transporter subunit IIA [Deltaproteobacteria bacterium]|nr:PTS sugar transporter subunit IIA [Deltaproteobacteria bacterium]